MLFGTMHFSSSTPSEVFQFLLKHFFFNRTIRNIINPYKMLTEKYYTPDKIIYKTCYNRMVYCLVAVILYTNCLS